MIIRPPDTPEVVLNLTLADANSIHLGLADLLCWVSGFIAACPEDYGRHPLGHESTRELSIAMKRAIEISENRT